MTVAQKEDRFWIADLLARAYHDNPTIEALFRYQSSYQKRFKLFSLLLKELIGLRSVYYDNSRMGVAVVYPSSTKKSLWKHLATQVNLVSFLGIKMSLKALKSKQMVDRHRKRSPHLYFWMLAIDPENQGIEPIQAIRDFSFSLSAQMKLPIYAETPLVRTKTLYQRYGFRCYQELDIPAGKLWMMERYV